MTCEFGGTQVGPQQNSGVERAEVAGWGWVAVRPTWVRILPQRDAGKRSPLPAYLLFCEVGRRGHSAQGLCKAQSGGWVGSTGNSSWRPPISRDLLPVLPSREIPALGALCFQ